MSAYYNENEPYAAQWLRNLIAAGHIAPGDVDERSIVDVRADDLRGYRQCHFFAGIGVWSYALRLAGWPDDLEVWTGSCPCQGFSAAGRKGGFDDERHLWPYWKGLAIECGVDPILGEQVASADGLAWLDFVCADLEDAGYTVAALDLCAAGFGAPHVRQRLFFVADTDEGRSWRDAGAVPRAEREAEWRLRRVADGAESRGAAYALADAVRTERWPHHEHEQLPEGRQQATGGPRSSGDARVMGDAGHEGQQGGEQRDPRHRDGDGPEAHGSACESGGPLNGFWRDADWLPCIDGKARPVEPLAQQMADGSAESLGRLRSEAISEIEKEVADAFRCEADAREAMHDLRRTLSEEAPRRWTSGRLLGVHEAPFLLAFLRQLADQGWALAQGVPCAGPQATEAALRGMRQHIPAACAPHQRGLAGQPPGEHPDAVRFLSSILARHAQAAWGEAFDRNASDAFPLIHGAPARVGRLRAYGNAIVAPVAAEFIRAYIDVRNRS